MRWHSRRSPRSWHKAYHVRRRRSPAICTTSIEFEDMNIFPQAAQAEVLVQNGLLTSLPSLLDFARQAQPQQLPPPVLVRLPAVLTIRCPRGVQQKQMMQMMHGCTTKIRLTIGSNISRLKGCDLIEADPNTHRMWCHVVCRCDFRAVH